jgi:hypothetical protein
MLILPMLLGAFRPPKPENRICCGTYLMITLRMTFLWRVGDAKNRRLLGFLLSAEQVSAYEDAVLGAYLPSAQYLKPSLLFSLEFTAPLREPTGSATVAIRLPFPAPIHVAPLVCCCKHKSTNNQKATFAFGPKHAIGHCVRASLKPGC